MSDARTSIRQPDWGLILAKDSNFGLKDQFSVNLSSRIAFCLSSISEDGHSEHQGIYNARQFFSFLCFSSIPKSFRSLSICEIFYFGFAIFRPIWFSLSVLAQASFYSAVCVVNSVARNRFGKRGQIYGMVHKSKWGMGELSIVSKSKHHPT